jgi:hypothetical protein
MLQPPLDLPCFRIPVFAETVEPEETSPVVAEVFVEVIMVDIVATIVLTVTIETLITFNRDLTRSQLAGIVESQDIPVTNAMSANEAKRRETSTKIIGPPRSRITG